LSVTAPPRPPPAPVLPLLDCIAVPAILVKLFAEALSAAWERRGLFNDAQEERLLEAGIELVTLIGRSKMVYISVPFSRKFCRMDICWCQCCITPSISCGLTHIIGSTSRGTVGRCSISYQAIRPDPIDMLHRAARLLCHYLAQASIVCCRRAV
jgi:hypothetical protein